MSPENLMNKVIGLKNRDISDPHLAACLAKALAVQALRNGPIENIHAGKTPYTAVGDYSDVKVVTPIGEIPWTQVSRITQKEMMAINIHAVNVLFRFLANTNNKEVVAALIVIALLYCSDWHEPEGYQRKDG